MRRPEYYTAPLFFAAVMLVTVICSVTLVAAWLVASSKPSVEDASGKQIS